ncbi:hypothetical protein [uncultured Shewanella sp.]|uniref:hypothetical protein n=1 Tax=uncultured Shewanella sp. TaxID=173975 RepID=UPI002628BE47|nr:hypothetical protein [uncultured Shewanella sp.]
MVGRNLTDTEIVKRIDKGIYALMFIAFIFYFPTTLLPNVFLEKNEKTISAPTMQAIPTAHSMSVNTFMIPFFGCLKRFSGTVYSRQNSLYTAYYWDWGYCEEFNLDYKLVKEGEKISVYYFKPISGEVELNSEIIRLMQRRADRTFRMLFDDRYTRMQNNKRKG